MWVNKTQMPKRLLAQLQIPTYDLDLGTLCLATTEVNVSRKDESGEIYRQALN